MKKSKKRSKSNLNYLASNNPRRKLLSSISWLFVISILGFFVLAGIIGLVAWVIATHNVGRIDDPVVETIYGCVLGLVIADMVLLIAWLVFVCLTIVFSRKVSNPVNGRKINILYFILLLCFIILGAAVIILAYFWFFNFFEQEARKIVAFIIIGLEVLRGCILLSVFISACMYHHKLRKHFAKQR